MPLTASPPPVSKRDRSVPLLQATGASGVPTLRSAPWRVSYRDAGVAESLGFSRQIDRHCRAARRQRHSRNRTLRDARHPQAQYVRRARPAAPTAVADPARHPRLDRAGSLRLAHRHRRAGLGRERQRGAARRRRRDDRDRPRLRRLSRSDEHRDALRRRHADRPAATTAPAFRIRSNIACRPAATARPSCGSRIPAAGSPAPTARPARAHGVVRVVNERHEHEQRLAYLSRFDGLTGEMNRSAPDRNPAARARRGGQVPRLVRLPAGRGRQSRAHQRGLRLRRRRRGDRVGRQAHPRQACAAATCSAAVAGNKFGVVLKSCTPDDMADRRRPLARGVRDDVVQTAAGPVAVTVTIGGVAAPRHARTVEEILARAQEALDCRQGQAPRLVPRLSAERRARGAAQGERPRRPTRSSPRSTSGAS